MKKSLLLGSMLLSISACAAELAYTNSVKNLYESADSTSKKGRLLPTSEIKILETINDKIKIAVEGFRKEGVPNAIYFMEGKRILVAGLSKSAKFDLKVLSENKDEKGVKWEKVLLTAYTKNNNLEKDINSIYTKAQTLYKNNCSMCHPAHPEHEFTANQWPSMFKAMANRTAITKKEGYLVTQYLQKHAKDVKGDH